MNLIREVAKLQTNELERRMVPDRFMTLTLTRVDLDVRWGVSFTRVVRNMLWSVAEIVPDSVASRTFLQVGDVLCSVNGLPITETDAVTRLFGSSLELCLVLFRPGPLGRVLSLESFLQFCRQRRKRQRDNQDAADAEEDDFVEVLFSNLTSAANMPHARASCTLCPFVPCQVQLQVTPPSQCSSSVKPQVLLLSRLANKETCSFCYCSLCNIPAASCKEWDWHCHLALPEDERRAIKYLHGVTKNG